MNFHEYEIISPIAHTSHGPILLIQDPEGMQYTLRFISAEQYEHNSDRLEQLQRHSFTWCANVVKVVADGERYGVVCQFIPGEMLADLVLVPGLLRPKVAKEVAAQLQQAVRELHQAGVAHGDITLANIVVSLEPVVSVHLIDFATQVAGTPGYQGDPEGSDFDRDIFGLQRVVERLGVSFPEGGLPEVTASAELPACFELSASPEFLVSTADLITNPVEKVQLSPAAMLRADLKREETQPVQLHRLRRKERATATVVSNFGRKGVGNTLRKLAGGLAVIIGALMLAWWLRQAPVGTENVAGIEKPELITVNEVTATPVCPSVSEAEAVLRQLLQIRNQALTDLDVTRLPEVYATNSPALEADQKLFTSLQETGQTVIGVSSELAAVEVKQCDTQVHLVFAHRLLEHQRCQAGECRVIPAGKARIEEVVLETSPWRISEIIIQP